MPVMAKNAGALQPSRVRQVATPRPPSAPNTNPPLTMWGHDGDAFRVIEHFFRDASIRSGHDLVKDLTGVREAVVCRFKRGVGPTESSQTQERN